MEPTEKSEQGDTRMSKKDSRSPKQPEWASGLQQLYKSVVDEPLPDSLKDLLSKLDDDA